MDTVDGSRVCPLDDREKGVTLPLVDISAQRPSESKLGRAKGSTKNGLELAWRWGKKERGLGLGGSMKI